MKNQKEIRCNPIDVRYDIDIERTAKDIIELNGKIIGGYTVFEMEYLRLIIKFLRKHENGKFSTIPHAIEMLTYTWEQVKNLLKKEENYHPLFIMDDESIETSNIMDGHIASTRIHLHKMNDPFTYWALSGDDWTNTDATGSPVPQMFNHNPKINKTWISDVAMTLYENIAGQWHEIQVTICTGKDTPEQTEIINKNYEKIKADIKTLISKQ